MKITHKQICPLCAHEASFHYVDHEDKKYFNCPTCSKYQIEECAERKLQSMSEDIKKSFSEKIKSTPENCLMLISCKLTYCADGNSFLTVEGNYMEKTKMLL